MKKVQKIETIAIHSGADPDPVTGAISPPIYLTSTYVQEAPGQHQGYEYSRSQNKTRETLECVIANLEGGQYGVAFASGCAAAATAIHLLEAGDHVICSDDVYGGTYRLFDKVLARNGLSFSFIDLTDLDAMRGAVRPETKAIWVETPTNPLLKVIDIAACAEVARKENALLFVDNTFATPVLQKPLELGADVVIHSTTKYISGHSDVVGGAAVTSNEEIAKELFFLQNSMGAVPSPVDAWITLRGLRTLPLRMERHVSNAVQIAQWLEAHPRVKRVLYPGLPSHPQYRLAEAQMSGGGGMVTFELPGDESQVKEAIARLKIFTLAESLGGFESLIEVPALMTHAAVEKSQREKIGIGDGLIRLSVGLEHVDDLIADLEQGLE